MDNYAQLGVEVDVSRVDAAEKKLLRLIDTLERMVDTNDDLKKAFSEFKSSINGAGEAAEKAGSKADKAGKNLKGAGDAAKGSRGSVGLLGVAFEELTGSIPGVGNLIGTIKNIGSAASGGVGGVTSLGSAAGALVGTTVGLAAVAGALGVVAAIHFGEVIDGLSDMADQTGRGVNELMVLQAYLKSAGLNLNDYEGAIRKVQQALSKTGNATSEETKAFKTFGVELNSSTNALEAAKQVAERYREAKEKGTLTSAQYAAAAKILGEDVDKAAIAIKTAADAEAYRQEMLSKGLGITEESIKASGDWDTATTKLGLAMTSMGSLIVQDLLPPITDLVNWFVKSYTEGGAVKDIFDGISIVAVSAVYGVRLIGNAFEWLIGLFGVVGVGLSRILESFTLFAQGDFAGGLAVLRTGWKDVADEMARVNKEAGKAFDKTNAWVHGTGKPGTVEDRTLPGPTRGNPADQKAVDAAANAKKSLDEYMQSLKLTADLEEARLSMIQALYAATKDLTFASAASQAGDRAAELAAYGKAYDLAIKAKKSPEEADKAGQAADVETNRQLRVKNTLSALSLISTEYERQRDIGAVIAGVDEERVRLAKKMNDEIDKLRDHQDINGDGAAAIRELEAQRERVLVQYNANRAKRQEQALNAQAIVDEERRYKVMKDYMATLGLVIDKKTGAYTGLYETGAERDRRQRVATTTEPYQQRIDALNTEREKLQTAGAPENAPRFAEINEELKHNTEMLERTAAQANTLEREYQRLNNSVNILDGDFTAWAHGGLTGVMQILDRMPTQAQAAASMVSTVGQALEDEIVNSFETGKFSVEDFFKTILKQLARLLVQLMVIKPLMDAIRGYSMGGASTAGTSISMNTATSASSGFAYNGAVVQRLSSGGIVNTLSSFNTTAGRTTVAEKNAEAVLPLQRNSKGQLGVIQAGGASAPSVNFAPAITVQVGSVQDASDPGKIAQVIDKKIEQSFKRMMAEEARYRQR